jgi:hypothetical protein
MTIHEAYKILGLSPESSKEDIRKQYLKLVKVHHPDKGGDHKTFMMIQAAYEILKSIDGSQPADDLEINIPVELRKVIDEIVSSFRKQYEEAEVYCSNRFEVFRQKLLCHISTASRGQLRKFNITFVNEWNTFINNIFLKFNSDCRTLIHKYDSWFEKTVDEVFEDMYRNELKSFKKSPRFYVHISFLSIIGFLIGYFAFHSSFETDGNLILYILRSIGIAFSLAVFTPLTWWIDCSIRKKTPRDLQVFDIVPFKLDRNEDFEGSRALKNGRKGTIFAGAAGIGIADALTQGIGGPLLGAAAGLVVGGIADRIMNPTKKIRELISKEFDVFSYSAKPEIINYVLEVHHDLLHGISEEIIQNYESRMKQTVLLLVNK